MASSVSLEDTILIQGTQAQWIQSFHNTAEQWGKPLTSKEYLEREEILTKCEFAKDGKEQFWVLVPKSDPTTLDFFSSCETFRRQMVLSSPSSPSPQTLPCYSIASVFTPPQHRSRGYAKRMMTLLHSKFRDPSEGGNPKAALSILYSDIGDYYSRAGVGWWIKSPKEIQWSVKDLKVAFQSYQAKETVRSIAFEDSERFLDISNVDSKLLTSQITNLKNPSFFVLPNGHETIWQIIRSRFYFQKMYKSKAEEIKHAVWGVEVGNRSLDPANWSFATWFVDFAKKEMIFLRLRVASPRHLVHILHQATQTATEFDLKTLIAWNFTIPSDLQQELQGDDYEWNDAILGKEIVRNHSLPAVAWYGVEGEDVSVQDLDWVINEKIFWC